MKDRFDRNYDQPYLEKQRPDLCRAFFMTDINIQEKL